MLINSNINILKHTSLGCLLSSSSSSIRTGVLVCWSVPSRAALITGVGILKLCKFVLRQHGSAFLDDKSGNIGDLEKIWVEPELTVPREGSEQGAESMRVHAAGEPIADEQLHLGFCILSNHSFHSFLANHWRLAF